MGHRIFAFVLRRVHLFILGGALFAFSVALALVERFNISRLQAFGPTAQIYFGGIRDGLITATAILLISFVCAAFFGIYLRKAWVLLGEFYSSLNSNKKNLLVLATCIVFAFASHVGNITNGYFNMDDFEVMGINHTTPFTQSLLIPHGNDHTIPLFTAEMKVLDTIFGQNEVPYNAFMFILFALIPFFTYLTFKRLGIGIESWVVFLLLFSGATGWAEMLTGFYIMSIYFQIILSFSIAMWAYAAWAQTKEVRYIAFFSVSLIGGLAADTSGIWILPAIFLFIVYSYWIRHESFGIRTSQITGFLRENKAPLISLFGVAAAFAIFLFVTFTVLQPHTFLSTLSADGPSVDASVSANYRNENWKPIPLAINFLTFFSSGVSLSLFAPDAAKIAAHPAVRNSVTPLWPALEALVVLANVFLLWLAFRYAGRKEKKFILLLFALIFITIAMVIVARPNHEIIPDFDYRYAGAPFYFYCLFLVVCASLLSQKKEYAAKVIFPIIIVVFAAQQAFSFYAVRLKDEAAGRREILTHLHNSLLLELGTLSDQKAPLTIPNLAGTSILESMPGLTLSDYLLFFNTKTPLHVIQNAEMPPPDGRNHTVAMVSSLRESTSPAFKQALGEPSAIRSYYASSSLMTYRTATSSETGGTSLQKGTGDILIHRNAFDPEKMHTVGFSFSTDDAPGNLEITLSFKNDLNTTGDAGKIRIDDYTPFTLQGGRRIYRIETDLLQLYVFALSEKVSDLMLHIPKTKNALLGGAYLK